MTNPMPLHQLHALDHARSISFSRFESFSILENLELISMYQFADRGRL